MNNPRKLAVATALSLAIFASVIAASASGTILCSTQGTGPACKTGHGWMVVGPVWSERLTPGKKVVVKSTAGSSVNECEEAEAEGEWTNGETGEGTITSQVFGGCNVEMTASASTSNPWPTKAVVTTPPNGYVEVGEVEYAVNLGAVSCLYGTTVGEGGIQFIGGEKAETKENFILQELPVKKFLCPDTVVFVAEWTVEKPITSFLT